MGAGLRALCSAAVPGKGAGGLEDCALFGPDF